MEKILYKVFASFFEPCSLGGKVALHSRVDHLISKMTYCGWENKELLIPFGMVAGSVFAGILKETAIELSKDVQEKVGISKVGLEAGLMIIYEKNTININVRSGGGFGSLMSARMSRDI